MKLTALFSVMAVKLIETGNARSCGEHICVNFLTLTWASEPLHTVAIKAKVFDQTDHLAHTVCRFPFCFYNII